MAQRKVNCEVYTDRGIVGKDGADGKSAYQQAVSGGYQGTEEEFEQALASDISVVADNVTNINAVGNNIENVNTAVDNMSAIIAAPTAATQAAASASQAATSATNAQTSETNAATSASNAATSATNASASATIATTKASEATSSATSASASANSASESATIATTQAELAKEYADSIDLSNYRTSADQDIIDATKATKAELDGYLPLASKAVANGVASLDANAKVPSEQIPVATSSTLGGVKPDGTTITVTENGTISAVGGSGSGTTGLSIGDVVFSYSNLASENPGKLPLFTGETIASANTIYPDFYNWVTAHTELQCTTEEYESALTTYGECAKYVIGGGSLRLPLIRNYIKAANPSEGIKNIQAGLPNVTGDFNAGGVWTRYASGAFKVPTAEVGGDGPAGNGSNQTRYTFDASRSSTVYGKSSTVTPASTTLYPWVVAYAAAIPASTAQAAEFQQGLSGKADTNLGNLSTSGKDIASGLGMPSNRYIDLTLGASGATYTAPANGWFFVRKVSTGIQVIYLTNTTNGMTLSCYSSNSGEYLDSIMPVVKGQSVICEYSTGGTTQFFRFVYAEGAE